MIRPLRLLLVSYIGDNRWSGMGKWSYKMADHLRHRGHHVELWFMDQFAWLQRLGRAGPLVFPWVLAGSVARAGRFDVVVAHEPAALGCGLLRRVWPDAPALVAMCHNVESLHFRIMAAAAERGLASVGTRNKLLFHGVRRHLSDGAIRTADRVVCLSQRDWEYVTTRLRRRPDDAFRMVNGVDEGYFVRDRTYAAPPRVLFVGGWLDVKGRRVLPQLWDLVRARVPGVTLSVVGTGSPAEVVAADFPAAARAGVRIIPRLGSEDEIAACYREHDIFLMPSLSEGSPLSLLEAMAGGLAVAAAAVGGVPDIVRPEADGILFRPFDSAAGAEVVVRLATEPAAVARFGAAGRDRAEQLTWDAAAACLEAAAAAAVADGHGGAWAGQPGDWPPAPIPEQRPSGGS